MVEVAVDGAVAADDDEMDVGELDNDDNDPGEGAEPPRLDVGGEATLEGL